MKTSPLRSATLSRTPKLNDVAIRVQLETRGRRLIIAPYAALTTVPPDAQVKYLGTKNVRARAEVEL
jgi:hypothetical protein